MDEMIDNICSDRSPSLYTKSGHLGHHQFKIQPEDPAENALSRSCPTEAGTVDTWWLDSPLEMYYPSISSPTRISMASMTHQAG
jgi:hypothetical protein